MQHLSRASAALVALFAVAGCPQSTGGGIIDTPVLTSCENNDQCSAGTLCVAGQCLIATCDPAVEAVCGVDAVGDGRDPNCCKVFENCNVTTLTCERDPNAVGIGCPPEDPDCIPCTENRDCVDDLGFQSFCSGGRCFAQPGRTSCTQDFNCSEGERCDRTEFFCVPASGACSYCGPDFPELCCQTGQLCDSVSGQCIEVGERECEEATVADDCRLGELCDPLGRCVQCITSSNCGPNTVCNEGTGLCESTIGVCADNDDCDDGFVCVRNRCEVPECRQDFDCSDSRELCNPLEYVCVLPPASCNEDDEPNNTPSAATDIALATGYAGVLCRGDQDFIRFPVQPLKRYVVTVTIPSGQTPVAGISLTLTGTTGGVETSAVYSSTGFLPLVGATGAAESGFFTLSVNSGGNTGRDQWSYTVVIREEEASPEPDCSAAAQAGQEPNDGFGAAIALTPATPQTFARCGTTDVDFFKVDVPPLHGAEFTVAGFQNAEGNLNVELFRGPSSGELVLRAQTTGNSEVVAAPEGSTTYYARVFLASPDGVLQSQSYTVTARAVPRPEACTVDVGENDGAVASAGVMTTGVEDGLVSGTYAARRCNPQDVDHVRFTVPPNLGGTLRLSFTHSEGDLALDLLDDAGLQNLQNANASNVQNGAEILDLPIASTEKTYVARVRLGSQAGAPIIAQAWQLALATFDGAVCLASEPSSDGTFATARCLGNFTPAGAQPQACPTSRLPMPMAATLDACQDDVEGAGCFLTCGHTDQDVYRIGSIESGRTISVRLEYATGDGGLNFQLARVVNGAVSVQATATDADDDGVITLDRVTNLQAAEYVVIVRPEGTTGHEGQLYALSVDISAPCIADPIEGGVGNQTAATATMLRDAPVSGQADIERAASLCTGDVDVYELFTTVGEEIEVTVDGLVGAKVTLATRPNNLANLPVAVAGATATADSDGSAELSFTSTRVQHYLIVERAAAAGPVGSYTLTLHFPVDDPPAPPPGE